MFQNMFQNTGLCMHTFTIMWLCRHTFHIWPCLFLSFAASCHVCHWTATTTCLQVLLLTIHVDDAGFASLLWLPAVLFGNACTCSIMPSSMYTASTCSRLHPGPLLCGIKLQNAFAFVNHPYLFNKQLFMRPNIADATTGKYSHGQVHCTCTERSTET